MKKALLAHKIIVRPRAVRGVEDGTVLGEHMEVIDNKALLLKLRDPEKVTSVYLKVKNLKITRWLLTGG